MARTNHLSRRAPAGFLIAFLGPALLLYATFVVWPLLQSFALALTRWRGVSARRTFVGLDNFVRLAQDGTFWHAVQNNLWMLIIGGACLIGLGVGFAHLVGSTSRGSAIVRSVFLFPQVISLVVVAVLWTFLYNPTFGLATAGLRAVGVDATTRPLLAGPQTALPAVTAAFVWHALGFYILLFAAGVRAIPSEVKEAAELDGAVGWRRFCRVTWPLLWSIKRIACTYVVINVLNVFALVYLMTQGGPDRATETMLTYLYQQAFTNGQFGYATAIAVVNFVIAMALAGALAWLFRRDPTEGRP